MERVTFAGTGFPCISIYIRFRSPSLMENYANSRLEFYHNIQISSQACRREFKMIADNKETDNMTRSNVS